MAKFDIKKCITALLNFFPKDIFICYNKFIISGDESDVETPGRYIAYVNQELQDIFNESLDSSSIYYINDIRKHKDNFIESLKQVTDYKIVDLAKEKLKFITSAINGITTWNSFDFTDEQKKILFDDRLSIYMDKGDIKNYFILSKSIIPAISASNVDEYTYTFVDRSDIGVDSFIVNTHNAFFDAFMVYYIIKV